MLHDFHDTPAFKLAHRAGFHDANLIAKLRFTVLVMRIKFLHVLDDFAEFGMRDARGRLDHDSLLHFCRDNLANAFLAETTFRFFNNGSFAHV